MKPQFRELMRKVTTLPGWTIRLWIDWGEDPAGQERILKWVAKVERTVISECFCHPIASIEKHFLESAEEHQIPLSALEILDLDGNGAVSYITWP